jgi:hypothetical protein
MEKENPRRRFQQDLTGIATLSHDPLATYDLHRGRVIKKKGSRK